MASFIPYNNAANNEYKSLSLTKQNNKNQRQNQNQSQRHNQNQRQNKNQRQNQRQSANRRSNRRNNNRAAVSTTPLWPNGVVYYNIDNSLSAHRRLIQNAMKQIQSKSCVRFQQRNNQRNYVQFFSGDGCYSSVGRVGGRQYLSLGNGCHDIGSAMHEILHALGFYHEHMRSDRDKYLTINWQNIERGMSDQFAKVPQSKNRLYTKFDFASIMIYGPKSFSKNGKNTMTPKVKGVSMVESHFKNKLSNLDVTTLNDMYRCN